MTVKEIEVKEILQLRQVNTCKEHQWYWIVVPEVIVYSK